MIHLTHILIYKVLIEYAKTLSEDDKTALRADIAEEKIRLRRLK
jgi:hypothetical protein